MLICQVVHVGKTFGSNWILNDASFSLQEGTRTALVGANGTGKTTLLALIAGLDTPDRGEIHLKKGTKVGYLHQLPQATDETARQVMERAFADILRLEATMNELSAAMGRLESGDDKELNRLFRRFDEAQKAFEEAGGYELSSRLQGVAAGLKLDTELLDRPYRELSGGEQTKIGLAQILLAQPDLLLLDEPTNHLDLDAIEWLEQFLGNYAGSVLLVSHDRAFLNRVVNQVLDLDEGEITTYQGNYSAYVEEREHRLLLEFEAYEEQQKKIQKMKETIKRLREWANRAKPPNAGMHRRAGSMEKALERMEKRDRPNIDPRQLKLSFDLDGRSGQDVVRLSDVTKGFADRALLRGINFHVRFGEKVAIVGGNGQGKSTLLKLILGDCELDSGEVWIGPSVRTGYLSQHILDADANPSQTVIDFFRAGVPLAEGEARHVLARFLFFGSDVFTKVGHLSGGERMRLRLAQLMHQSLNTLILDEPTNHLDIPSREVLEEAIASFPGTVIAVSHDRYFLNKLFTPTFWLADGTLTRYEGTYSEARRRRTHQ